MSNERGDVWITFNGEVSNFRSLRGHLQQAGHRFRSLTDTEVVVHAYEQWGADCVQRLRGMFAFAIFDGRGADPRASGLRRGTASLFLARDRLGIKPLYYTVTRETFIFASETRAILASGLVPRRLSLSALGSYLQWGSVAEPETLVEGIRSLPPGHRMSIRAVHGALDIRDEPYWSLAGPVERAAETQSVESRTDVVKRIRMLLEESVALNLQADVPVGVFLSGGIDSTSIAALAARHSRLHSVTVTFPSARVDEATPARRTAERLGTCHHEVALTAGEELEAVDAAVVALDQPSMDGVNTYLASWAAAQAGLKVALTGLGGDELFGGYPTFTWVPRLQRLARAAQRLPTPARQPVGWAFRKCADLFGKDTASKLAGLWSEPDSLLHSYGVMRCLFAPTRLSELLNGTAAVGGPSIERSTALAARAAAFGEFSRVSLLELGVYLTQTLLRDTDCLSMAHSLEVRVPYLDHVLVDFLLVLPEALRSGPRWWLSAPKALLADAVSDILPTDTLQRRKRPFALPWGKWLGGRLSAKVEDRLAELAPPLRPFLDAGAVRSVWRSFRDGRTGWARPWSLYVLNTWTWLHLTDG
jgi:asparagine synthase (glutamine-hydrolysing)